MYKQTTTITNPVWDEIDNTLLLTGLGLGCVVNGICGNPTDPPVYDHPKQTRTGTPPIPDPVSDVWGKNIVTLKWYRYWVEHSGGYDDPKNDKPHTIWVLEHLHTYLVNMYWYYRYFDQVNHTTNPQLQRQYLTYILKTQQTITQLLG